MHYKNRKPKGYKGCCWMCACHKGHVGGLRNKRRLTQQEKKAAITAREEGLRVRDYDLKG